MLLGLWLWAAEARADAAYLAELLDRADAAGLSARRQWRTLLHYRSVGNAEGVISDADDPHFFLDPTGKTDPRAELAATLRAFFKSDRVGADPQPAQCAFMARYQWLKGELGFDGRRLQPQNCERFQHWLRELNAESATLVFASAYLNNPASLFGHTLLRLDRRGQTEQTRLLAYAINYAADDSNSNALRYAVDGISGRFEGQFEIQPYYKLVRTYSDLESRDLWEYRLHLSQPQFRRLIEHVWELRGVRFDYYFFRENCAWQLLTLLEVTDPNLRLSDKFILWTLPADTIRHLIRQPDWVEEVIARPARGTTINRRYEALTARERRLARRLRNDPTIATQAEFVRLARERQALLLELALSERRYSQAGALKEGYEAPPDGTAHRLLIARNHLRAVAAPVPIEPYASRPELGHASRRAGIRFGQREGVRFIELNARASYHDLLEPEAGYTPDAQIEILGIAVRRYEDRDQLTLNHLTLLDITSLPPINTLTPRPAWRIHVGWEPYPSRDCFDCAAFNISGGLGVAGQTRWPWRTVWFAVPGLELHYSSKSTDAYRAGFGFLGGALLEPTARWKVLAKAAWLNHPFNEGGAVLQTSLEQNLVLDRNLSLRINWRYQEGIHECEIGLQAYF